MYNRHENPRLRFPGLGRVTIVLGGILLGFMVSRFFIVSFTVSDDSMQPNLKRGDLVYLLKVGTPRIGDVILFSSPAEKGAMLLKRVIAAEGDTVEIRNKIIYINNRKANFTWKTASADTRIFPMSFTPRDSMTAVKLEQGDYFVLGDNFDQSFDSRFFGPVGKKTVAGRVIYKH